MKAKVLVEISARHVHVSQEHLEVLFGPGYSLTPKKMLSQPGQFAAEERVDVVGPRSTLKNVSILGPCRSASQVEITKTEARALGVDAVLRESGHIEGTNGIKLVGPKGELDLKEGLIVAKRHVHLNPEAAADYEVHNGQIIAVRIDSDERDLIFGDVVIRVSDKFSPAMHIDTDEANAAGISYEAMGELIIK